MTSIEWLVEQIEQYILTYGNLPFSVLLKFKKQAKEMHKQEIIDSYKEGHYHLEYDSFNPENWYNQTFKKD